MSVKTELKFTLNGRPVNIEVPVEMTVLNLLRENLDLKGTKYACGEGECGACTIEVDGTTINSCLMYAADLDGREVLTIEGMQTGSVLHPMQQSFVKPEQRSISQPSSYPKKSMVCQESDLNRLN